MDKITLFFKNYASAIKASNETKKNFLAVASVLKRSDVLGITKYEVSLKIKKNRISPIATLSNIDADGYSCKDKQAFLDRLLIFKSITRLRVKNPLINRVYSAIEEISKTPMDLYFGADVKDNDFLFSFWLIFGGANKDGQVNYWPYDFNRIISAFCEKAKLRTLKLSMDRLFHLSINIDNKNLFYEFYYEKVPFKHIFANLIRQINNSFVDYKHLFCSSIAYSHEGKCLGKRIFTYFPQGVYTKSNSLKHFLKRFEGINGFCFDLKKLAKMLQALEGEINLVGFEQNGSIRLYLNALT